MGSLHDHADVATPNKKNTHFPKGPGRPQKHLNAPATGGAYPDQSNHECRNQSLLVV